MSLYVKSSALTHPGRKRSNNQDFVTFFEPDSQEDIQTSGSLYIVADGVGGAAKGDRASQYAAQKVLHEYYRYPQMEIGERLKAAMRQSGNEIFAFAEESSGFRMATTMVVAVVRNDLLTVANVGDSRAYLIRNGVAKQITRDHSLVGEMVRDGVMTEEEARHSKVKNRITRSLGGEQNVHVDVFRDIPLQVGDKVLLCSDGFSQYANPVQIAQFISQGAPSEITERMIDHALKSGGSDNISTILLEAVPATSEAATLRIKRGQMPTAVDWETMDTSPATQWRYQRRADWFPPFPNWQVVAIGLLAVAVFSSCIFGGIYMLTRGKETPMPPVYPTAEVVIPTEAGEVLHTATVFATFTPFVPTNTSLPTITPSVTNAPDNSSGEGGNEVDSQQTSDDNIAGDGRPKCQYSYVTYDPKIATSAWLLVKNIFKIEIPYLEFLEYAKDIQCADIAENPCIGQYENTEFIRPGWTLMYPDIAPKICKEAGGIPVPSPNPDN